MTQCDFDGVPTIVTFVYSVDTETSGVGMNYLCPQIEPTHDLKNDLIE